VLRLHRYQLVLDSDYSLQTQYDLRSEPSSRAALMGEQPNPWDRLQPQDATSRHRTFSTITGGVDYIFTLLKTLFERGVGVL
jgi:hypothetical protein